MIPSLFATLLLQTAAPAPTPAPTPVPAPVCAGVAPPPAGFAAWQAKAIPGSEFAIGSRTALTLRPIETVTFSVSPERNAAAGTFGGVYPMTIKQAGSYRIALSTGAWIDLLDAKRTPVKSVGHIMGPPCSGIRKIVDFDLGPGRYTLQLSGAPKPQLDALIVAK